MNAGGTSTCLRVAACFLLLAWQPGGARGEEEPIPEIPELGGQPGAAARTSATESPPVAGTAGSVDQSLLFDAGKLAQIPAGEPRPPRAEVLQVDASGEIVAASWERRSKWIWISAGAEARALRPVLRSWFRLPAGLKVTGFSSKLLQRVDAEASGPSPFSPASGDRELLVVDSDASSAGAVVKTSGPSGSGETGLVIRFQYSGPLIWAHSGCREAGVVLRALPGQKAADSRSKFVFLSLHCRQSGGETILHVHHSRDAAIQSVLFPDPLTGRLGFDPRAGGMEPGGVDWTWSNELRSRSRRSWPASSAEGATAVAGLRLGRAESEGFRYGILHVERSKPATPVSYFANVGFSYLDYSEDVSLVTEMGSSELVTTLKGGIGWKFWPPRWDASLSGYVSALFLSSSVSPPADNAGNAVDGTFGPARFYGINGRVGYLVSDPRSALEWKVSLGGYYWGMLVQDDEYGIRSMVGPQILLSLRNSQDPRRRWGAYLKFAATGDSSGFRLSNRELALGGDYQIATLARNLPLSLTLDVAQAGYVSYDQSKNMTLNSASLGVQTSF